MTANEPHLCWWCGAAADSREHKFKKSELILNHGAGPWVGEDAVVWGNFEGSDRAVQGPNSTLTKFPANLCQNCNNSRSQPFDLAYDTFITYMAGNSKTVGRDLKLRFSDIYGSAWEAGRTNLVKYWVKHICCRADDHDMRIPDALRHWLSDPAATGPPPHAHMILSAQGNLLNLGIDGSWIGDGMALFEGDNISMLESHTTWRWIRLSYQLTLGDPVGITTFEGNEVELSLVEIPEDELPPIAGK